jgi:glycosyltransferase involved in cell wall biosynthesis
MTGISAVIATYNRRTQLETLFESIIQNNFPAFEAIVVDQNTDGLIDDIIEKYQGAFEIHHLKITEPNQSKARNIGASMAKYSVICFPDDDCWFDKDTLPKIINYFGKDDYKTDLLIINWQQHPKQLPQSTTVTAKSLFSFRSVGYGTIVLIFKTAAFRKLGGFLEYIGIGKYIGGGEDSELTFRAASCGMKLYYNKDIKINHLYKPIVNADLSMIRSRQRAMGFLFAKYKVPLWVIVRGLASPMLRMILTFRHEKRKKFYNIFLARIEGLRYGVRSNNMSVVAEPAIL